MKKIAVVLLSLLMIIGLVACSGNANQSGQPSSEGTSSKESTSSAVESTSSEDAENMESTAPAESESETPATSQDSNILVAYFSATNTTEGVAEHIANGLNAELFEIVPEQPYTSADLDWNDNDSRSTIEMNDPTARPAISGSVENMDQYDVVLIGYPIWWSEAPRIISTFLESYDFSGKTIVPFCTSGGSGIDSSAADLEQLTSGAQWLEGRRLNGSDSQEKIMEWVNSLGLDQ